MMTDSDDSADSAEFDEFDVSENEFDRMLAEAEPVTLASVPSYLSRLLAAGGTYYALSVSTGASGTAGSGGSVAVCVHTVVGGVRSAA